MMNSRPIRRHLIHALHSKAAQTGGPRLGRGRGALIYDQTGREFLEPWPACGT